MTTQRRNQSFVRGGSGVTLALGQKDIYGCVGVTLCALAVIFVVQSLSHVRLFVTPRTAACQDSLSCTISWSLLKLMSIETMMPSNHLILCRPLLLLSSVFPKASGSFPMSRLFTSRGQNIGASASVFPMNIQG